MRVRPSKTRKHEIEKPCIFSESSLEFEFSVASTTLHAWGITLGIELLQSFISHANAHGSKSTALAPLGWIVASSTAALLCAIYIKASNIIIFGISVVLVIIIICYLFAFFYFMFKNPDCLRSERFAIRKMEIEKTLVGDDLKGVSEVLVTGVEHQAVRPALESRPESQPPDDQT